MRQRSHPAARIVAPAIADSPRCVLPPPPPLWLCHVYAPAGLFVLLPHASTPGKQFVVYAWRSEGFKHPDGTAFGTAKEYADAVARSYAKTHLPDGDAREIVVVHEEQGDESDAFWDLFES